MSAFNLHLGIGNLFDFLNNWFDSPSASIEVSLVDGSLHSSVDFSTMALLYCSQDSNDSLYFNDQRLPSVSSDLFITLVSVINWQLKEEKSQKNFSKNRIDVYEEGIKLLNLPTLLPSCSFHLLLHRYFTSLIGECCKFPQHTSTILSLQSFLKCLPNQPLESLESDMSSGKKRVGGMAQNSLTDLIDYPLQVINMSLYLCKFVHIYIFIHTFEDTAICIFIYIYILRIIYINKRICTYLYMHIYLIIYIHIHECT